MAKQDMLVSRYIYSGDFVINGKEGHPFDELPEALVEEMLNQCNNLGDDLSKSFKKLYDQKGNVRARLRLWNWGHFDSSGYLSFFNRASYIVLIHINAQRHECIKDTSIL